LVGLEIRGRAAIRRAGARVPGRGGVGSVGVLAPSCPGALVGAPPCASSAFPTARIPESGAGIYCPSLQKRMATDRSGGRPGRLSQRAVYLWRKYGPRRVSVGSRPGLPCSAWTAQTALCKQAPPFLQSHCSGPRSLEPPNIKHSLEQCNQIILTFHLCMPRNKIKQPDDRVEMKEWCNGKPVFSTSFSACYNAENPRKWK
jgi:hypothetical protein